MWDFKACSWKILRIRPTEIEFENNFSSLNHRIYGPLSTVPFLLLRKLRIRPTETKCEADFSSLSQ